jgi:ribosome-associated translation inhibitor RaiA
VLVSIVQRHTALPAAQKALLRELAARAARNFRQLDELEWVVTKERLTISVGVRLRSRGRFFRATATAPAFSAAAHQALERILTQSRRTKRARVDGRDDGTPRGGSGGRRRPLPKTRKKAL